MCVCIIMNQNIKLSTMKNQSNTVSIEKYQSIEISIATC